MPIKRPVVDPRQVYHDRISRLIRNLLIENKNYTNGYYADKPVHQFRDDTKERAQYILEEMEGMKHLIIDEDTK
jgi:hypothetical protein